VRGTLSVIGNGVVLDPWHFRDEVGQAENRRQGVTITPEPAHCRNCPADPAASTAISTACAKPRPARARSAPPRRGIGPAYEDKVGRRAIRVCDLAHLDELEPQIDRLCAHHDALRAGFGQPPVDRARLMATCAKSRRSCCPMPSRSGVTLERGAQGGARILFEGAQGVLLDVDHGTYPFVTSSNTVAARPQRLGPRPEARASCSASSRPIPPASAPARSRPSWKTRSASARRTRP
jgi:adenylosuccinate synthase